MTKQVDIIDAIRALSLPASTLVALAATDDMLARFKALLHP